MMASRLFIYTEDHIMLTRTSLLAALALIGGVSLNQAAMAASWQVTRLSIVPQAASTYNSLFDVLDQRGQPFSDGEFLPLGAVPSLGAAYGVDIDAPYRSEVVSAGVISFGFNRVIYAGSEDQPVVVGHAVAPIVDLANMRADFSSLFYSVYVDPSSPGLIPNQITGYVWGYNIGAAGWVPLTAGTDGSYSAQWTSPVPADLVFGGSGGELVTMSFAPVPEASTTLMGMVGLALMAACHRRRAQQ